MSLLLQGILRHCLIILLGNVEEVLQRCKLYSIDFRNGPKTKTMFIRFRAGARLIDVDIRTIAHDIPVEKVSFTSQLQSAVGTRDQIMSGGSGNADVLKDQDRKEGGIP